MKDNSLLREIGGCLLDDTGNNNNTLENRALCPLLLLSIRRVVSKYESSFHDRNTRKMRFLELLHQLHSLQCQDRQSKVVLRK